MDYTDIFIYVIIVTILFAVMSNIYKDKEKVDKGFKVNYFRLSYRRRMIRSLFSALIVLVAFVLLYIFDLFTTQIFVTLLGIAVIGGALEVAYNYRMWKKHEGDNSTFSENGN